MCILKLTYRNPLLRWIIGISVRNSYCDLPFPPLPPTFINTLWFYRQEARPKYLCFNRCYERYIWYWTSIWRITLRITTAHPSTVATWGRSAWCAVSSVMASPRRCWEKFLDLMKPQITAMICPTWGTMMNIYYDINKHIYNYIKQNSNLKFL